MDLTRLLFGLYCLKNDTLCQVAHKKNVSNFKQKITFSKNNHS